MKRILIAIALIALPITIQADGNHPERSNYDPDSNSIEN